MPFLLILKNLKLFIKNKPVLFIFIVIVQIICVISALASAGMINDIDIKRGNAGKDENDIYFEKYHLYSYSVNLLKKSENYTEDPLYIIIHNKDGKLLYRGMDEQEAEKIIEQNTVYNENGNLISSNILRALHTNIEADYKNLKKVSDVREKFDKLIEAAGEYLWRIEIYGYVDNKDFVSLGAANYYNQQQLYEKDIQKAFNAGKYPVVLSFDENLEGVFTGVKKGDTIKFNNTDYVVVGIAQSQFGLEGITVLYPYVDDDFLVSSFWFNLKEDTPPEKRAEIDDMVKELFGYSNVEPFEGETLEEKQFNNMVYVVSFVIIAVIFLNIARIYTYIKSRRQKAVAICRLCGANMANSAALYMAEILITIVASYIVGALIFHYFVLEPLSAVFQSFTEFFTFEVYLNVFAAYVVIGIIIIMLNLIPIIKSAIVQSKSNRRGM